jgi:hypothetical protein
LRECGTRHGQEQHPEQRRRPNASCSTVHGAMVSDRASAEAVKLFAWPPPTQRPPR